VVDIAIPHDVLEGTPDDREKVRKIGYIGRAAAIFRVGRIYIYTYGNETRREDVELLRKMLEYMRTPPYLRKYVFKLSEELKLAGLLPPLRLRSFVVSKEPRVGEVRLGVVTRWDGYYSILYIGGGKYAKIPKPYPIGKILAVRIEAPTSREDTYRAHVVDASKLRSYLGFNVEVVNIKELFKLGYKTIILTGREGRGVCDLGAEGLEESLIIFGGPKRGVDEILASEGIDYSSYPFLDFVMGQGVETIRTEEAILVVLSVINYVIRCSAQRKSLLT